MGSLEKNAFKATWKVWIFRGTQFSRIGGSFMLGGVYSNDPQGALRAPQMAKNDNKHIKNHKLSHIYVPLTFVQGAYPPLGGKFWESEDV
jgi:hypothetical protein